MYTVITVQNMKALLEADNSFCINSVEVTASIYTKRQSLIIFPKNGILQILHFI